MDKNTILTHLNIPAASPSYSTGRQWNSYDELRAFPVYSPIDQAEIGKVNLADENELHQVIEQANAAFQDWRLVPAPKRGEIVRQIGLKLREKKEYLGRLVTLEMGKIYQEGLGEVQEMIDICDFAVGLSRQLHGLTMHSERPGHRMYEQYHPLGIVGIISAFNFPVAVWSWNAMIAAVCGNVSIWKPSEKTPLTAIACQKIVAEVLEENDLPEGIFNLVQGDAKIGQAISAAPRISLVSATGSTAMGKKVAQTVGGRLGKTILELGGNNAIIISEKADLELAIPATVFGAVGTAGQRCTSTRRLIVQDSIYDHIKDKLVHAYGQLTYGNPLKAGNLVGPLIDQGAVDAYFEAIEKAKEEGGKVLCGAEKVSVDGGSDFYVKPTIIEVKPSYSIVQEETFAPILYIMSYDKMEDAMAIHNNVKQGLSSAIFSDSLKEAEFFLSHRGSDCGIANVNIGTSGAEIGGAFGGEKDTGGGRESGSDAWKAYMRRQTNTINYSNDLPLAQGIDFSL